MKIRQVFLALICLPSIVYGVNLFVTTTSQSSKQNTYKTLVEAQNAVRNIIKKGITEDITVHIADGTYNLDLPLNFTTADSGRNGHTVYWKATGSKSTISGEMKVSG